MSECTRWEYAFWSRCVCEPCTKDRNRKAKLWRCGKIRHVTSDAAWTVIDRLVADGWTGAAIASAAGLNPRTIEGALVTLRGTEKRTTFQPLIAAAIVKHGRPTIGLIGATPARRRLQGLACQGWDLAALAERSGIGESTLASIRTGYTTRIRAQRDAEIRALVDDIGMTVGPSTLARDHASRKKWPSLMSWDDIDNTSERPKGLESSKSRNPNEVDEEIVARLLTGRHVASTRAEKEEAMRRWTAAGKSIRSLCVMHGWHEARYTKASREDVAA